MEGAGRLARGVALDDVSATVYFPTLEVAGPDERRDWDVGPLAAESSRTREFTVVAPRVGRLLFGVTYRATDRASINWSVEVGATDDATDVRSVLRIPLVLLAPSR